MSETIAKAYVQLIPSAEGMSSGIEGIMKGETSKAGSSIGGNLATQLFGTFKKVLVGLGIGKLVTESLMSGADLQQSMGGIETLFKESADKMKQYANEAYKTAGLSANEYMEQSTSFAASLLQSLDGDTAKAAESANQAIIDMADNANKMGTSIESIQNAYQGFAKQNFTMLDNLKLGYGGTKEEMQRLLDDAEKISGVKYDIKNLDDIYSAIHIIQGELGITGTTAKEAEKTFSGSLSSMKAAASNLLASLTGVTDESGNAIINVQDAMSNLIDSAFTFVVGNLVPMLVNIVVNIPQALISGIKTAVPKVIDNLSELGEKIAPEGYQVAISTGLEFVKGLLEQGTLLFEQSVPFIMNFVNGILENLPTILITAGSIVSTLIQGMLNNLPSIIQTAFELMTQLATSILDNLPSILSAGLEVITNFIQGMDLGLIIQTAWDCCLSFIATVAEHLPDFVTSAIEVLTEFIAGLISMIPDLITGVGELISNMVDSFMEYDWLQLGYDMMAGVVEGIGSGVGILIDAAWNAAKSVWDTIVGFFEIGSPSKKMRRELGPWIPAGIGLGIEDNADVVGDAINSIDVSGDRLIENSQNIKVDSDGGIGEVIYLLNQILDHGLTLDGENVAKNSDGYIKKWDLRGASTW